MADLAGLWAPRPAFLVCGGPSLATLPLETLRDRGVASLAINNAGAYAPARAHVFGDPQIKFHSAMFLDPGVLSFVPFGKLRYAIQIKHGGEFWPTNIKPCDCPSVVGFSRDGKYDPATFLTTPYASWGHDMADALEKDAKRCLCTVLLGIRILHYLGCPRIYLLGVDHDIPPKHSGRPGYAWGDAASSNNRRWLKVDVYFDEIRPVCEASGMTIFNCNPASLCESFEYVPFETALLDCRGPVEVEPLDCHDWYNKNLSKAHHSKHPRPLSEPEVTALRNLENHWARSRAIRKARLSNTSSYRTSKSCASGQRRRQQLVKALA